MQKLLLIAEKPSLMRAIQSAYNNHKSEIQSKVGEIDFMALHGHACEYLQPKQYEEWDKKWADIDLPMIPTTFKIQGKTDSKDILNKIATAVKSKKYNAIIVATDADVEGNGIYWLISQYLNIESFPAYRFFEQDQTEKGIIESLLNLTDYWTNPRDVRMTEAYKLRSQKDWLVGMNFTTGFTVKSGFLLRIGSVKAPTLKLIYDNCEAIDNFKPTTDYALQANFDNYSGTYFDENGEVRFKSETEANDFAKKITRDFRVISIETKKASKAPEQLYKLADIQTDAGRLFGYDLQKTLDIVQQLYEMKYVSYPRTDGRYISEEKGKDLPKLIDVVKSHPELNKFATRITNEDVKRVQNNKKYVNTAEAAKASHDALLPTTVTPDYSKLNEEQKNILTLIYKRLIALFLPDYVENKTTVVTASDNYNFKTNGKKLVNLGWRELYDYKSTDVELPDLKQGQIVSLKNFSTVAKTTTPPKRFTQATLGEAMEHIYKYIDDKNLKDVMKLASGLGQPSSRGSIIKELFTSGYIEERGKAKGIYMTPSGKKYVEIVKDFTVCDPTSNAEWETKLNNVRSGDEQYDKVRAQMITYIHDTINELKEKKIEKTNFNNKFSTDLICPACGKPLLNGQYGLFCSGKRETGCKFSVPKVLCSKTITEKMAKDLISKKKTGLIKGFKNKAGTSFDAYLVLNDMNEIKFAFQNKKR